MATHGDIQQVDTPHTDSGPARRSRRRFFPWVVFGLAFGLLISDYMSRQVLSAIFPFLKSEWLLSDSQLASLTSVVALMVGLLTLPISILADRWGRVRSLVIMAVIWSIATMACGLASNYEQMLAARFVVGVGEAAYGSVALAVVLSVFHPKIHSSLSGTFMAGGSFGSVFGVALGGVIAVQLGWRWSFLAMAVFGLILVAFFMVLVTERRLDEHAFEGTPGPASTRRPDGYRAPLSSLFKNPAVLCAYVGGGLQMFTAAILLSWTPSFFNRYYEMAPDKAGGAAAGFVLLVGVGMVVCGIATDRLSRSDFRRKWLTAVAYCLISLICLTTAFQWETGPIQIGLLAVGAFFSGGSTGSITAMVANLTHPSIRASALGTMTVANNLLGLALGPYLVGVLADHLGLLGALQLAPLAYIGAVIALAMGWRLYPTSLASLAAASKHSAPTTHPTTAP